MKKNRIRELAEKIKHEFIWRYALLKKSTAYLFYCKNYRDIFNYIYHGKRLERLILRNNIKIYFSELDSQIEMFNSIWLCRQYNTREFRLRKHDIVIDIGANIGVFSLFAATRDKTIKVYAFEASPRNFALLAKNVEKNDLSNIKYFNCAIGGRRGKAKIYHLKSSGWDRGFLLNGEAFPFSEVEQITLKDIFDSSNIKRCNFLKMDVEGAEYDILFNTPPEYFGNIERISMEYHEGIFKYNRDDLIKFFNQKGFSTRYRHNNRYSCGIMYAEKKTL